MTRKRWLSSTVVAGFVLGVCALGPTVLWAAEATDSTVPSKTLEQSDRDALMKRLSSWPLGGEPALVGKGIAEQFADRPVVPYLCQVVQDPDSSRDIRCHAMVVLSQSNDKRAIPVFKGMVEKTPKENMSDDEWNLLHCAILCLGRVADDPTLDLLFEMATDDYWQRKAPTACEKGSTPESLRSHMRLVALNAIAFSGNERAIHAFKKKKEVPKDMRKECPWLLKCAEGSAKK